MDAVNLAVGIFSVAVSCFAVWLAFRFYQMSEESSRQIQNSARDIEGNVKRIEELFGRLYTDSFALVRETYMSMSQHVLNPSSITTSLQKAEYLEATRAASDPSKASGQEPARRTQPVREAPKAEPTSSLTQEQIERQKELREFIFACYRRLKSDGKETNYMNLFTMASDVGTNLPDFENSIRSLLSDGSIYTDSKLSVSSIFYDSKEEAERGRKARMKRAIEST